MVHGARRVNAPSGKGLASHRKRVLRGLWDAATLRRSERTSWVIELER